MHCPTLDHECLAKIAMQNASVKHQPGTILFVTRAYRTIVQLLRMRGPQIPRALGPTGIPKPQMLFATVS